jgi:hypothetical protein
MQKFKLALCSMDKHAVQGGKWRTIGDIPLVGVPM